MRKFRISCIKKVLADAQIAFTGWNENELKTHSHSSGSYRDHYARKIVEYNIILEEFSAKRVFGIKWLNKEIDIISKMDHIETAWINNLGNLVIYSSKLDFEYHGIREGIKMEITINPSNSNIIVCNRSPEPIFRYNRCIHPHVYPEGKLCIGASTDSIKDSMVKGSLVIMAVCIMNILKYPDADNPVVMPDNWPLVKEVL